MFRDQNALYNFDLQIRNGPHQRANKSGFYESEQKYNKQHLFNGNLNNRLRNTAD